MGDLSDSTALLPVQRAVQPPLAKGALVLMRLRTRRAMPGVVRRVASDRAWAEVEWRAGELTWASRVAADRLEIVDPAPPQRMTEGELERWAAHGHVEPFADQ